MLNFLSQQEKEEMQKKGYMYEHLLCLYSMVSDRTAMYNDAFPVFLSNYGDADVLFFSLSGTSKKVDEVACLKEVSSLPVNNINIISPDGFKAPNITTKHVDWDYHIRVDHFDFDLNGHRYKKLRYNLRRGEKTNLRIKCTRDFTSKHTYLLSRHMVRRKLDVWDCEELLSLERFFREHKHGLMMEVYQDDMLVGFDVVDFFEGKRIMVVPLGIYLQSSLVSDFMMYENLKFARDKGYEWVDVGPTCGSAGIRRFKEKWFAKPKYKLYVQQFTPQ